MIYDRIPFRLFCLNGILFECNYKSSGNEMDKWNFLRNRYSSEVYVVMLKKNLTYSSLVQKGLGIEDLGLNPGSINSLFCLLTQIAQTLWGQFSNL